MRSTWSLGVEKSAKAVGADIVETLDLGCHFFRGACNGEALFPLVGHPVAY